jgi:murein L,D-transpeptidase YafK
MTDPWRTQRLVLALMLASGLAPWPAFAVSIELNDAAPDRVERQRAFAENKLPLAGTPDLAKLKERLAEKGLASGAPVLIRVFKAQSELELWMEKEGSYVHFATYPICHWSGTLGPKLKEGDKQTPEGFYTITARQLHRAGRWPESLNLGYPNAYDRSLDRNGSYILVHGGCSSVGCFAMTNPVIAEIYELTGAALRQGQKFVPVHVFPFRMTDENFAAYKTSPWLAFWQNMREGYDAFERMHRAPLISYCNGRYLVAEPAPGEGGEAIPLAPCGATSAALPEPSPAAAQPTSPRPRPRNSTQAGTSASLEDPSSLKRKRSASADVVEKVKPLQCSLVRASCRRFSALQERKATRKDIVSAPVKVKRKKSESS